MLLPPQIDTSHDTEAMPPMPCSQRIALWSLRFEVYHAPARSRLTDTMQYSLAACLVLGVRFPLPPKLPQ